MIVTDIEHIHKTQHLQEDARSELSSLVSSFWEVGACFLGLGFTVFFVLFICCFSKRFTGSNVSDHKLEL